MLVYCPSQKEEVLALSGVLAYNKLLYILAIRFYLHAHAGSSLCIEKGPGVGNLAARVDALNVERKIALARAVYMGESTVLSTTS